jgi:membrane protein
MSLVGVGRRIAAYWRRARNRYGWVDHLSRAGLRYDEADGGRLGAAVTYYAFFAVFALALLAFAILGYVLDRPAVLQAVQRYLTQNLPRLDLQTLRQARGAAGIVGLVGLPITGVFWVDSLRSSIRAIWRLNEYPGNYFVRQLIDLLLLAGLGLLVAVSLAIALGTGALLNWLVSLVLPGPGSWVLSAAVFVLGFGVNTLLAVAVLTGLPRLRMTLRRVLGPALLIAAGIAIMNTLGRLYVSRTAANPAYQVVAGAVGLLVFLKILNQLILFAAALTATSESGEVIDLACRPPRRVPRARPDSPAQPDPAQPDPAEPDADRPDPHRSGTAVPDPPTRIDA